MTARGRLLPDPDARVLIVPVYLNGTELLALRSAAARDPRLASAASGAEAMLNARGYDLPEADTASPSAEANVGEVLSGAATVIVSAIEGLSAGLVDHLAPAAVEALAEILYYDAVGAYLAGMDPTDRVKYEWPALVDAARTQWREEATDAIRAHAERAASRA